MTTIFAQHALLPEGWRANVRVTLQGGKIVDVLPGAKARAEDARADTLLPAMPNVHSHTFQRAMAGMTEQRSSGDDSFWTWRETMYRFVQLLTPEDVEAVAAFAFMEMQEVGFGSVAEFHYLHHALGGEPYDNRAELSARIIAAAQQTGIGLTLLPVLYSYAGLGQKQPTERQLRFINSIDDYFLLHESASAALMDAAPGDARMGFAPHSLRAVSMNDVQRLAKEAKGAPFHLHIAEQTAEVEDVRSATGFTPVEWLLRNNNVNQNWCLIHATHMTAAETTAMANVGGVAGLCPLTEANLGDGIFDASEFLAANGAFGIGTDSNINISVASELSMLEYGQRLRDKKRNVLAADGRSTGTNIFARALHGGAQALGRSCGAIAPGMWADLMAIDSNRIELAALRPQQFLDCWIFATHRSPVTDLWSAGRHCVESGSHIQREKIEAAYRKTLRRLADVI